MKTLYVAVVVAWATVTYAAEQPPDYRAEAEAFVAKCLKDPNVFMLNPPLDAMPADIAVGVPWMTKLLDAAKQGSDILMLYPDGMPAALNAGAFAFPMPRPVKPGEAPKPMVRKQWYPDGRPASVEEMLGREIVSGTYYDAQGGILGRVDKGTGTAYEFRSMLDLMMGKPAGVSATCEYVGGKRNGLRIEWFDYAKKLKSRQERYKDGQIDGLCLVWTPAGPLLSMDPYESGRQVGDYVVFGPTGKVLSAMRHSGTGEESPTPTGDLAKYDPKIYLQAEYKQPPSILNQRIRTWPTADEPADASGVVTVGSLDKDTWGVRPKTGEIVLSADAGKTWKTVKADLGFVPRQIVATADGTVLAWGLLPTETPLKGLPNRIAYSPDRGATWQTFSAPLDYVTTVSPSAGGILIVTGKCLPPEGLKAGDDWVLLQDVQIITTRTPAGPAKRWTVMWTFLIAESKVVQTVQREGSDARLYVIGYSAGMPGSVVGPAIFKVQYHASLKDMPRDLDTCKKQPEASFGADGNTVEIREPGAAVKTIDLRTGKAGQ